MKANLIIVGDELLSGKITDCNGPYLMQWLQRRGFRLNELKIVGDDQRDIGKALGDAWKNADLVIVAGGLGPTEDDQTKAAVKDFVQEDMQENGEAKNILKRQYQRLGKTWFPQLNLYHFLPKNCFPVENHCGLAVGLGFAKDGKLLLAAPGVPSELKGMAEKEWPALMAQYLPQERIEFQQITVRFHGIGEEQLFKIWPSKLCEQLESFGKLSSLPQILGLDLVFSFQGNESEKKKRLEIIKASLNQSPIAPYIWQWGEVPLPHFLIQKLKQKKVTLGLAESCTGGLIADSVTDVSGASEVLRGGIVAYTNQIKISQLGVSPEILRVHGAVSEEVAKQMANGARNAFQTDYGVSVTGLAGPDGGTPEKPVGTVIFGMSSSQFTEAKTYHYYGHRRRLKEIFARQGLFLALQKFL